MTLAQHKPRTFPATTPYRMWPAKPPCHFIIIHNCTSIGSNDSCTVCPSTCDCSTPGAWVLIISILMCMCHSMVRWRELQIVSLRSGYHIAVNFWGRKLSQIRRKWEFHGENFHGLFETHKWVRHAPKFHGENFHGWLSNFEIRKSFLPRKFPAIRYIAP